jgi:spore coat protein SA
MKIAFISAGVLPIPAIHGGAVETLVENIINKNEEEKKLDITIFSIAFDRNLLEQYNYKYTNIQMIKIGKSIDFIYRLFEYVLAKIIPNRARKNLYIFKVIQKLKKMNFDAVIIENRPQYVIPISSQIKTRVILHLHNDTLNSSIANGLKVFNNCDEIFTVSDYIRKRVLSITGSNINKIKVLFNGIDLKKFNGSPNSKKVEMVRNKYSLKKEDFLILFVGRLLEEKGVKELINAFNRLEGDNLVLIIVGSLWYDNNEDSGYINQIKRLADTSPHEILFTGYVDHTEIPLYHASSKIIVIPSKWEEPCSLAVFEALSSGVATIVSDSGGTPEIVGLNNALIANRKPNFTDSLHLSLSDLINNTSLRGKLEKNSKEHVKRYSLDNYFKDFVELLSKK